MSKPHMLYRIHSCLQHLDFTDGNCPSHKKSGKQEISGTKHMESYPVSTTCHNFGYRPLVIDC